MCMWIVKLYRNWKAITFRVIIYECTNVYTNKYIHSMHGDNYISWPYSAARFTRHVSYNINHRECMFFVCSILCLLWRVCSRIQEREFSLLTLQCSPPQERIFHLYRHLLVSCSQSMRKWNRLDRFELSYVRVLLCALYGSFNIACTRQCSLRSTIGIPSNNWFISEHAVWMWTSTTNKRVMRTKNDRLYHADSRVQKNHRPHTKHADQRYSSCAGARYSIVREKTRMCVFSAHGECAQEKESSLCDVRRHCACSPQSCT